MFPIVDGSGLYRLLGLLEGPYGYTSVKCVFEPGLWNYLAVMLYIQIPVTCALGNRLNELLGGLEVHSYITLKRAFKMKQRHGRLNYTKTRVQKYD